ncbi:MAG: type VI secretion system baseplate subunit TssK [Desulfonauticus sp.]|nr:type VI secretion system baseplate subunit TssK [Desulfonauticus sp.]
MAQSPRPILWHQGLFLQPHHFQQLERNIEYLFSSVLCKAKPFFWGITSLDIDIDSIGEGYFKINKLEALFQDGSWVAFPGNAKIVSRSFKQLFEEYENRDAFKVYIGLAKWDLSTPNVKEVREDSGEYSKSRFVSLIDPERVEDLYLNGPPASVRFMNYVLKIFWDSELENLGDYFLIPVAVLKRDGSSVVLSKEFIPPVLSLNSSASLKQIITNIRDQIASRVKVLEGYKLLKEISFSDLQGNTLRYVMALIVLNKYIPLLTHFINIGVVHPCELYGKLLELIGELSSFTDRINAMGRTYSGNELVPEYDHKDIGRCFLEVKTLIEELLSSIIVGAENIIKLERDGDEFCAQIPFELLDSKNRFSLVLNTKEDKSKVVDAFDSLVKVAPKEMMTTLISRALPGLAVIHKATPPAGLPKDPHSLFFELDTSDPLWMDLKRTGNICLYWDNAPEDLKVMLVVSKF